MGDGRGGGVVTEAFHVPLPSCGPARCHCYPLCSQVSSVRPGHPQGSWQQLQLPTQPPAAAGPHPTEGSCRPSRPQATALGAGAGDSGRCGPWQRCGPQSGSSMSRMAFRGDSGRGQQHGPTAAGRWSPSWPSFERLINNSVWFSSFFQTINVWKINKNWGKEF